MAVRTCFFYSNALSAGILSKSKNKSRAGVRPFGPRENAAKASSGNFLSYIGYLSDEPDAGKTYEENAQRGKGNLRQWIGANDLSAAVVAVFNDEKHMQQINAKTVVAEHFNESLELFAGV